MLCKQLKNKKAPGLDGLTSEHVKHIGDLGLAVLVKLFNSIATIGCVPQSFKHGLLVPIPKGDKDKSIQSNYRGITLLPTLRKLFEKVILQRVSKWVREEKIIDDLQGGDKAKCSSLETNLVVRETIAQYREENTNVYVCMLDAKKAYDGVWQDGLFYKMFEAGMDRNLWMILIQMFSNVQCRVKYGKELSESFVAKQGIVQGGPLSLIAYELYNNELLTLLKASTAGTSIGRHCTTCPAFADDVTLIAPTKSGMQKLLSIAQRYASKWRYEYNITKCSVIVYGKDPCPSTSLLLGTTHIPIKASDEHVGTVMTDNNAEITKYIKRRIEMCKKRSCAITGIGSYSAPMLPKSASKLYWAVCVPKLTYGLHLMDLPPEASTALESYHAQSAKTFQGLPERASNDGALFMMGWPSITGYIDIVRLMYFMRILLLPQ